MIQNERPPEQNGSKNEKEHEGSFEAELPEKQQQEDINGIKESYISLLTYIVKFSKYLDVSNPLIWL